MQFLVGLLLLFIVKLRFGKKPLNYVLTNRYGRPAVKIFRKLQNLHLRRSKATLDCGFLTKCKASNVIPRFLELKCSQKYVHTTKFYRSFQFKCLNFEIRNKQKKINQLKEQYKKCLDEFKSIVSWLDFKVLTGKIFKINESKTKIISETHHKKLLAIGATTSSNINADKVIFNFSDRQLTKEEKDILQYGLKFSLPCKTPKFVQHFLPFENIVNNLYQQFKFNDETKTQITCKVRDIAHNSFNHRDPSNNFNPTQISTLKNLKKDKNIVITRPDKGNGVVILNKIDYINKTELILNDKTKFKLLKGDWFKHIITLEDKLNRLLRKIRSKLTDDVYNFLFASGSTPGILYGLPKVHKADCPIRPILSAINTFNYNLAKFFVPILSPLTTNEFTIKNSYSFVKEITNLHLSDPVCMASFDIKSLFTNIPLSETIDICIESSKDSLPRGLTISEFRSMLELAVKESMFVFNDKLYQQVDGVAMGSPLGPTLANTFLCFWENRWLDECPSEFKPILYRRYVDDCFLLFKDKSHVPNFLQYLNNKHPNISYTVELENNNSLAFLDVLITRNNDRFSTTVYRKDTFTGLGLNFFSYVPSIYKINSVKTLLFRAYHLSSSWLNFDAEISKLRKYFNDNGYPKYLFDNLLNKFLQLCFNPIIKGETKEVRYIKLNFQGHYSYVVRKQLSTMLRDIIPDVSFRFVFTNNHTIGSFFNIKDRLPDLLCSNIVYLFQCPSCSAGYVGSTTRNLTIRISEHRGISFRTNRMISNPSYSMIREHSLSKDHRFREENFKIVYRARNIRELRTAESLIMYELKPKLINNELAVSLNTIP